MYLFFHVRLEHLLLMPLSWKCKTEVVKWNDGAKSSSWGNLMDKRCLLLIALDVTKCLTLADQYFRKCSLCCYALPRQWEPQLLCVRVCGCMQLVSLHKAWVKVNPSATAFHHLIPCHGNGTQIQWRKCQLRSGGTFANGVKSMYSLASFLNI